MTQQIVKMVLSPDLRVSLNQYYAGQFWKKRHSMKNAYLKWFLQYRLSFVKIKNPCEIQFDFHFKKQPMDCDNTVFMGKCITDCLAYYNILKDDTYKHVKKMSYTSQKTTEQDHVILTITEEVE